MTVSQNFAGEGWYDHEEKYSIANRISDLPSVQFFKDLRETVVEQLLDGKEGGFDVINGEPCDWWVPAIEEMMEWWVVTPKDHGYTVAVVLSAKSINTGKTIKPPVLYIQYASPEQNRIAAIQNAARLRHDQHEYLRKFSAN